MFVISPILNRELLTFLRRKRAFVGLLIYLFILAATAGIVWWQGSETEQSIRARDFISRTLFHSVTIAQLLIFSAYSLILTSTKINSERDEKTLDLLISAPLSSLHIILAKYFSALAVILLLIIASLPFLSLSFLLGGLSGREVVSAYAIVLAAVLAYGMIGLAASALCRRNYVALATAFVIAMTFYFGLTLLSALVINALDRGGNFLGAYEKTILFALCIPSPLGAYAALMVGPPPSFGTPTATFVSNNILYVHLAFEALVLLVFFAVAWRRFRLIIAPDKPVRTVRRTFFLGRLVPVNPAPKPAPEAAPASNREVAASRFGRLRRGPRPIADGVNPVFAREDRMLFSRRLRYRLLRLAIAAAILLISAAMFWEPGQENNNNKFSDYMAPLGIWTAFLVAFFAPLLAARAVTSERETHCLPLLAVSTLRPFEILWGKFAVLLKHVLRAVALFTLVVVLFMLPLPKEGYPTLLADWTKILLPLLSMSVFYLSIGLFCSTLFRKTVTAVIASYGVAAAGIAILVLALIYNAVTGADMDNMRVATPFLLPPLFFAGETTSFFDPAKWFSIVHYCVDLLVASAVLLAFAVARFAELTGARVTSRGRGAEI